MEVKILVYTQIQMLYGSKSKMGSSQISLLPVFVYILNRSISTSNMFWLDPLKVTGSRFRSGKHVK